MYFDDYALFVFLAGEKGYIIEDNPSMSITVIDVNGWEHLMPYEYDSDKNNYFYHNNENELIFYYLLLFVRFFSKDLNLQI